MKSYLASGLNGTNLIFDLDHRWISVGYTFTPGGGVRPMIAVEYDGDQVGNILVACQDLAARGETPRISIEGEQIQISYVSSPVPERMKESIESNVILSQLKEDLRGIVLTSIGEVFPQEKTFQVFKRLFAQEGSFDLLLMPPSTDPEKGSEIPLAVIKIAELKQEIETFFL